MNIFGHTEESKELAALNAASPRAFHLRLSAMAANILEELRSPYATNITELVDSALDIAAHFEATGPYSDALTFVSSLCDLSQGKWPARQAVDLHSAKLRLTAAVYGAGAVEKDATLLSLCNTESLRHRLRANMMLIAHVDATFCCTPYASRITRLSDSQRNELFGFSRVLADLFVAYSWGREAKWDDCARALAEFRRQHATSQWMAYFSDAVESLSILLNVAKTGTIDASARNALAVMSENVPRRMMSVLAFLSVANAATVYAKLRNVDELGRLASELENEDKPIYVAATLGLGLRTMAYASKGIYTRQALDDTLANLVNTHMGRMLKPFAANFLPHLVGQLEVIKGLDTEPSALSFTTLGKELSAAPDSVESSVSTALVQHLKSTAGPDDESYGLRRLAVIRRLCKYMGFTESQTLSICVDLLGSPDFRRLALLSICKADVSESIVDEVLSIGNELVGWTIFEAFDLQRDKYLARLERMYANATDPDKRKVLRAALLLFQLTNLRRAVDVDVVALLNLTTDS
ncbi:MAG: hypothetical protein ING75_02040 [Rhodocyclaceae bacterium]|nr:hypothetical protein [Rhodocyclaceae bacterium]